MAKRLLSIAALFFPMLLVGTLPGKGDVAPTCAVVDGNDAVIQDAASTQTATSERVYHLWCGGTF